MVCFNLIFFYFQSPLVPLSALACALEPFIQFATAGNIRGIKANALCPLVRKLCRKNSPFTVLTYVFSFAFQMFYLLHRLNICEETCFYKPKLEEGKFPKPKESVTGFFLRVSCFEKTPFG